MATKHPRFAFGHGYRIRIGAENHLGPFVRTSYRAVGRLDDGTPFSLMYGPATHWDCPVRLGDGLRRKILGGLRRQVRFADDLPPFMADHDFSRRRHDARAHPEMSSDPLEVEVVAIEREFEDRVWRDLYLDDRDEDHEVLSVPYAEKDEAKALGTRWNGKLRAWWVKRSDDMSAFSRWMNQPAAGPKP